MKSGVLGAALAATVLAAPAGAATVTGPFVDFAAEYTLGFADPAFTQPVRANTAFNDSRTVVSGGVEFRGAARGAIVNGRPELGFSISAGPVVGARASASVGFFDGLLLATPVEPRDLPSSLVFNLVTTFSGTVDGIGRVGAATTITADRDRLDRALADARSTANIFRQTTAATTSAFNRTLTFQVEPANSPGLVEDLRSGTVLTEQELNRRRREARARQARAIEECVAAARAANSHCAVGLAAPTAIWEPLAVSTVGLGVAFGGFINDQANLEIAPEASIDAFNSLTLDGIYITNPDNGAVIPFWIAGFSGLDYTLAEFRPTGENPFALDGPAVIPLPAAGWLLIGALAGLAGLGRLRRRA